MNRVALSLVLFALVGCAGPRFARVTTADGPLKGVSLDGASSYLAVPFARPPVNERRFAAPVQNAAWKDEREALVMPAGCSQLLVDQSGFLGTSSEDCLYLNVFTPELVNEKLPVMLYFPGGAFIFGAANEALYDASRLAKAGNVIVVVANYRLGPFGFAAHPALSALDSSGTSGNWGLLDQREAMRWVQRNVSAFGGDPTRVTIFGESAGASSVCMHLLSDGSKGLYQRAIMESVPCTGYPVPTRAEAETQGSRMATALGCVGSNEEIVACLRNKPELDVLRALRLNTNVVFGEGVAWGPTVDGVTLVDQPIKLMKAGKAAPVPIIVGANANEGSLFLARVESIKTEADLKEAISELFTPAQVNAAVAHYGLSPNAKAVGERMLGDIFFCDSRRIARLHSTQGNAVYRYYFARNYYDIVLGLGAFHGAELPFVFGTSLRGLGVTAIGRPLQDAMQGYWSTFARKGDPNGSSRPGWTRYQQAGDAALRLDLEIRDETQLRTADCDFWDTQL